jgi:hypothetical protein
MLAPYQSFHRLMLMACNKPENLRCPKCKTETKEDQSTKAFREFVESNPTASEAKVYDV